MAHEPTHKPPFETAFRERAGYNSYFVGQNIIYIFVTIYLAVYFSTALGISAAVVGLILMVARVWDAAMDPLFSIVVEKSRLKGGKFKPWINSVAIIIPLLTVLMFAFTEQLAHADLAVSIAYATITYFLWGTLYTVSDAPAFALATVMTRNLDERNTIISFSKIFALVGIAGAMVAGPVILQAVGNNWFLTTAVLSGVAMLCMFMIVFAKERVKTDLPPPSLREIFGTIFANKYLVVIIVTMILYAGTNYGMTITPFLANDVFHDPGLTGAILGLSIIPTVIVAPLSPLLIRRFGKNALMLFALVSTVVFSVIIWAVGYQSVPLFLALTFLKSLFGGFVMVIAALFFADCIEYDDRTKGKRFEAATFAAQTFTNKILAALAGAGGMWLLALYGFREAKVGETIVQSAATVDGMWLIYNLGPAVGSALAVLVFAKFYDLTEKKLASLGRNPVSES